MSLGELLAECLAHPDDDQARLVWADAVGGERGELVAIQCADRSALRPVELAALNRRERALLARAMEWSGLAGVANRVRFRRGFVDAIDIDYDAAIANADRIAATSPLVTSLTLRGLARDGSGFPAELGARLRRLRRAPFWTQLRALDLMDPRAVDPFGALVELGMVEQVVALGLSRPSNAMVRALVRAGVGQLERLWLRNADVDADAFLELGLAATRLRALDVTSIEGATDRQFTRGLPALVDLTVRSAVPGALAGLAPLADRLERLVVRFRDGISAADVDTLQPLHALRVLDLGVDHGIAPSRAVLLPPRWARERPGSDVRVALPNLRELAVGYASIKTTQRLVGSLAPQVELLDLRRARRIGPTACLGDELVDDPVVHELLHAGPVARGEWRVQPIVDSAGTTQRPSAPAWLVIENDYDAGYVVELGELDRPYVHVVADVSGISLYHDGTRWLISREGPFSPEPSVNGARVQRPTPLSDGARLVIGTYHVRFFTGDGGGARATQLARALAT